MRATELGQIFEAADQRLAARVNESADAIAGRATELGQIFETADQRLAARVNESAEAIAARATELGQSSRPRISGSRTVSMKRPMRSPRGDRLGEIFETADQRLAARVNESADAIAAERPSRTDFRDCR